MLKNNLKNIFDYYNSKLGNGHKLTKYKLSKLTDIPRATINRLISNPSASMNMKTLNNLVEFFNVPVSKLLVYRRNPYRFKLMNATNINKNKLTERVKSRLNKSIALRSVDYHQTVIFTPIVKFNRNMKSTKALGKALNVSMKSLDYKINYDDISKYPVYNAIKLSNILNKIRLPLIHSLSFHLLSYITDVSILHSGLISKVEDNKLNKSSGLITDFKGLTPIHKSSRFRLNSMAESSVQLNNDMNNRKNNNNQGYFLSEIKYYRKHYGKRLKNKYSIHFPNAKLIDDTTINYK